MTHWDEFYGNDFNLIDGSCPVRVTFAWNRGVSFLGTQVSSFEDTSEGQSNQVGFFYHFDETALQSINYPISTVTV